MNNIGYLRILNGEKQGETVSIRDGLVVGRDARCDIYIPDSTISRKHCTFKVKGTDVEIIDLDSRNGTKVNGQFINTAILKHGDRIGVGETILAYEGAISKRKIPRRLLIYLSVVIIVALGSYLLINFNKKNEKERLLNDALRQGKEEYQKGNYDEALNQYRIALKLLPDNEVIQKNIEKIENKKTIKIQLERAQRFFEEAKFDQVEQEINNILAKDPENKDALALSDQITKNKEIQTKISSVEVLKSQNDFDGAIVILKQLYTQTNDLTVKQNLITTIIAKGYYLEGKGQNTKALDAFQEVLTFDPINSEAKSEIEKIQSEISEKPHPKPKQKPKPKTEPETTSVKPIPTITLTEEQKKQAEDLFWEGYAAEKDRKDMVKAKELYQKVLKIAPDPNFEYYQKAKKRLEGLK